MAVATVWTVEHQCGHSEDHDLSEIPAGKRAGRAQWYAGRDCFDCYRSSSAKTVSKTLLKEREAALTIAWEYAEQQDLAVLRGSEKQIDWALTVRHGMLVDAYAVLVESGGMSEDEYEQSIVARARLIDSSRWWIDNREMQIADLPELLADAGLVESGAVSSENPY